MDRYSKLEKFFNFMEEKQEEVKMISERGRINSILIDNQINQI